MLVTGDLLRLVAPGVLLPDIQCDTALGLPSTAFASSPAVMPAALIAAAPGLCGLRRLCLSDNDGLPGGLMALANAKYLNELSVLQLAYCHLFSPGVRPFGSRAGLPALAVLDLSDNGVHARDDIPF